MVIVGIVIYRVSVSYIENMALNSSDQVLTKVGADVDGVLTDMKETQKIVSTDVYIQEILQSNVQTEKDRKKAVLSGNLRLGAINEFQRNIYGIYVLLDNGLSVKSRYFAFLDRNSSKSGMYEKVKNRNSESWFKMDQGSEIVDTMGEPVLTLAYPMKDLATERTRGIIAVEIKEFFLQKLLSVDIGEDGLVYLMNEQNQVITTDLGNHAPGRIAHYLDITQKTAIGDEALVIDEQKEIMICKRLPISHWVVVGIVSKSHLRQNGTVIAFTIAWVCLLFWILTVIISRLVTKYELLPIRQMIAFVKVVESGNFQKKLPIVRNDEIGALTKSFNNMTEKLSDLIDKVYQEQQRLRKAEFKAMQAQISPHFLYNTLDSINWLSRQGKNEEVTEMVAALSSFFKIGLSRGKDLIPIEQEIEHVRSYLTIQKIRYRSKFEYFIMENHALDNFFVPKLILQPLVENSLYHGIKVSEHKCTIMISVLDFGDSIVFEVMDDGVGMTPEQLEELRKSMSGIDDNKHEIFGVVNVNDRIQILSGKEYGLTFESEHLVGTVASIRIRKISEDESHV